jgi:dephospho-CoA kinase
MFVAGLTGNFGSGKTSVLEEFGGLGAFTINTDKIVAGLLEKTDVLEKVEGIFGSHVFDLEGRLLRKRVARIIFMDVGLRTAIEDLLHPMVFSEMEKTLKDVKENVVVVEAPVIFERGYQDRFDRIITVYADFTTVLKRLAQTGIPSEEVYLRHGCQMPASEKINRSDFSIDNNGTEEQTVQRVREIYLELSAIGNVN